MSLEDDLQEQLRIAWEAQSLLTELATMLAAGSKSADLPDRRQKLLERLAGIVGDAQILAVRCDPSVQWELVGVKAKAGAQVSEALIQAIATHPDQDYVALSPDKISMDPVAAGLAEQPAIEAFPFWRDRKLRGFYLFGSANSLLEQPYVAVIKAIVRGTLGMDASNVAAGDDNTDPAGAGI